jgi:hypothetical protein
MGDFLVGLVSAQERHPRYLHFSELPLHNATDPTVFPGHKVRTNTPQDVDMYGYSLT